MFVGLKMQTLIFVVKKMSKFLLAERQSKCLYVYNTYNVKADDYTLEPYELKLVEPDDRIYSSHWLIDRDHLFVQWDIYSGGDEWQYSEQNCFDATIFSLLTYQPLVTCTIARNRGFIVHQEIVYSFGRKVLCLFTVEGYGHRETMRVWDWQQTNDDKEMVRAETYEEWSALIENLKLVVEDRVNLLVRKHFEDSVNCQYSEDSMLDRVCIGGDPVWSQPGWKNEKEWKFGCSRETDKMTYSNQDLPELKEREKDIKYHLLKTGELCGEKIHNLAILIGGEYGRPSCEGHWNYQIISFPCSKSTSTPEPPTLKYKKDLLVSDETIPMENFLVLSPDQLIVVAQEYLLLTDVYLNFQYELPLPRVKSYFLHNCHSSILPCSSLEMKRIMFLIDEALVGVMPIDIISIVLQYLM